MIKNVIFDLGNVLFVFNRHLILQHYVKDDGRLENIIFNEWLMRDEGVISDEEFLAHLKPKLNKEEYEIAQNLLSTWIDTLPFNDQTYEFIKWLKKEGVNVFALSNIPLDFVKRSKQIKQMQEFCDCVFSSEEKLMKPDRRIFIRAIEKFKISPEKTLYIDDVKSNVDSAKECGMQGYVFDGDIPKLKEFFLKNKK